MAVSICLEIESYISLECELELLSVCSSCSTLENYGKCFVLFYFLLHKLLCMCVFVCESLCSDAYMNVRVCVYVAGRRTGLYWSSCCCRWTIPRRRRQIHPLAIFRMKRIRAMYCSIISFFIVSSFSIEFRFSLPFVPGDILPTNRNLVLCVCVCIVNNCCTWKMTTGMSAR